MKVGKPSDIPVSVPSAPAQGAKGGRAAGRTRAAEDGAGVTVSVRARSLVEAEVSLGSDIDMHKVEAVRMAIQQGTFKINPEVIADRLLANAKEMLGQDRA